MLDYGFLKQIRLASIVAYFIGFFAKVPALTTLGFVVYILTYMYTYGIMETAFFKLIENQKKDGKTDGEEKKDEEN